MINEALIPYFATACFALAVLHTFSVKFFQSKAHKYPEGSVGENLFHLLGEVEVVFGIWAGIFILSYMLIAGTTESIAYLETRNFTEPMFVFVIMTICASRPILALCEKLIQMSTFLPPIVSPMECRAFKALINAVNENCSFLKYIFSICGKCCQRFHEISPAYSPTRPIVRVCPVLGLTSHHGWACCFFTLPSIRAKRIVKHVR